MIEAAAARASFRSGAFSAVPSSSSVEVSLPDFSHTSPSRSIGITNGLSRADLRRQSAFALLALRVLHQLFQQRRKGALAPVILHGRASPRHRGVPVQTRAEDRSVLTIISRRSAPQRSGGRARKTVTSFPSPGIRSLPSSTSRFEVPGFEVPGFEVPPTVSSASVSPPPSPLLLRPADPLLPRYRCG